MGAFFIVSPFYTLSVLVAFFSLSSPLVLYLETFEYFRRRVSTIDEMATPLCVKYPGAYYHGINDPDYAV